MTKKISNKILKQLIKEAINEQTSLNERRWTVKDPTRPSTEPPKPRAWRKVKAELIAALGEKNITYTKGWWKQIPNRNDPLRRKFRDYWKAVKYHRKSAQHARADKATSPEEKGLIKAEQAYRAVWTAIKQFSGELKALQELPVAEGMNLRQLARTIEKQFSQVQGSTGKQLEAVFKKITGRPALGHLEKDPKSGATKPKNRPEVDTTPPASMGVSKLETDWDAIKQSWEITGFKPMKFGSQQMIHAITKGIKDHNPLHDFHRQLHRVAPWLDTAQEKEAKSAEELTIIKIHNAVKQREDAFHAAARKKTKEHPRYQDRRATTATKK